MKTLISLRQAFFLLLIPINTKQAKLYFAFITKIGFNLTEPSEDMGLYEMSSGTVQEHQGIHSKQ